MTSRRRDERDVEILRMTMVGYSRAEIGRHLGLTRDAVSGRIGRIKAADMEFSGDPEEMVERFYRYQGA